MSFIQLLKHRTRINPRQLQKPQRQGRIRKLIIRKPRKPNSAKRKTAKVFTTKRKYLLARVPGHEYFPIKFAGVLLAHPGSRDTPNVNYHTIRGTLECLPLYGRLNKRSKYGISKRKKVSMTNIWFISLLIIITILFLLTNNITFFYNLLLIEIIWILLFFFGCTVVTFYNSITILTWTLILLCIATSESAIGLAFILSYFDQFNILPDSFPNSTRFQSIHPRI